MLLATGIGTYLRALLPRVIARIPDARFCLLGSVAELEREALGPGARVELRETTAGIYSPREQPELWRRTPRETRVFWAPHVNAPLAGPGRLLATVHDAFYAKPPAGAVPRLDKLLYLKLVQRGVQRRASAVLCVSAFTKAELERLLGPFRGPLHVVPNGVEPSWF